jgi:hypothetical protein
VRDQVSHPYKTNDYLLPNPYLLPIHFLTATFWTENHFLLELQPTLTNEGNKSIEARFKKKSVISKKTELLNSEFENSSRRNGYNLFSVLLICYLTT